MAYTAPIIKDRVAVGDDLYLIEDEGGKKRLIPSPTEVVEEGTPINKELLQALCDAVENAQEKHVARSGSFNVSSWNTSTKKIILGFTGVTSSNTIIVGPAPTSQDEWSKCQIWCTAQGNGTITLQCKTIPSKKITVNVIILNK